MWKHSSPPVLPPFLQPDVRFWLLWKRVNLEENIPEGQQLLLCFIEIHLLIDLMIMNVLAHDTSEFITKGVSREHSL